MARKKRKAKKKDKKRKKKETGTRWRMNQKLEEHGLKIVKGYMLVTLEGEDIEPRIVFADLNEAWEASRAVRKGMKVADTGDLHGDDPDEEDHRHEEETPQPEGSHTS